MNDFGFIDYKKPIGECKDDMRTSTYRSHVYMTDTRMGNYMHAKIKEPKPYRLDPNLEQLRTSDYKANFVWKYEDPNKMANPTIGPKMDSMKNFEDRRLRFISRPMRPACSIMHNDYIWDPQSLPDPPSPLPLPAPVAASHVTVNRAKPGYTKLLDPAATTSRLAYVHYTPDELMNSVARHDNITFWNWNEKSITPKRVFFARDETMCNDMAAKECPKRRCEFPSVVPRVPNSGMTTEVRANYVEPIKRAIDFHTAHIKNRLVHDPVTPSPKATEYKLYGSGERTLQYV
ncbi:uncharacterized protein [Eurosta solidaginis]|uniref:uncharacterized protein n=1 Tax=Eurosta solidaginis TaxID=178769 RepID=UPI003530A55C